MCMLLLGIICLFFFFFFEGKINLSLIKKGYRPNHHIGVHKTPPNRGIPHLGIICLLICPAETFLGVVILGFYLVA
jgi:hypothetical protein